MAKKIIKVVAAAIIKNKQLLAFQRSEKMTLSGLWEFPGGKIEENETHQEALKRELLEELEMEVEVESLINTASYEYDFGIVEMTTYRTKMLSEKFNMKEHAQYRWLNEDEIMSVEWAPVDIPAAEILDENKFN